MSSQASVAGPPARLIKLKPGPSFTQPTFNAAASIFSRPDS
jgi:hypothetical protein